MTGLFIAAAVFGYLLGSVPFGVVLTRAAGVGDVRRIGSGNIGATNVLRTGRKDLAAATLVLDGAKGAVALLLARWALGWSAGWEPGLLAGFTAVLGHSFPVWLGFRGGKGVATGLGVLIAAAWPLGLAACAVWLVVAGLFRISSAAGLGAFAAAPFLAWALAPAPAIWLALGLAVLIFVRHRGNIKRLLAGTEPRIGRKS